MQTFGQLGGVAQHERHRPVNGHSTMTADGRRKVVTALAGQDWTPAAIATALGISEAIIDTDLNELAILQPEPVGPAKPHSVALLEAYATTPTGLTAQEAGKLAGIDRAGASKRIPELRKRGLIKPLADGDRIVQRSRSTVYIITEDGHLVM